MIKIEDLHKILIKNNIHFFTGVPDSLMKDFSNFLEDTISDTNHLISCNEGNSVSYGIGYHLATNKIPLVYLQNSGLGNIINPITSMIHQSVYSIPMLLLIGWRGEIGEKDEPQHIFQGGITKNQLKLLGIEYDILNYDINKCKDQINDIVKRIKKTNKPYALLVRKNTFSKYLKKKNVLDDKNLIREKCIELLLSSLKKDDIIISTTGKTSRELNEKSKIFENPYFMSIGGMGHASQIALGLAENTKRRVFCFDGDGSILMHLGGLATIGERGNKNFYHVVFDNEAHESVGGQKTVSYNIDFEKLSYSLGYKKYFKILDYLSIEEVVKKLDEDESGPTMIHIKVKCFSRENLSRPSLSPFEHKINFKNSLSE